MTGHGPLTPPVNDLLAVGFCEFRPFSPEPAHNIAGCCTNLIDVSTVYNLPMQRSTRRIESEIHSSKSFLLYWKTHLGLSLFLSLRLNYILVVWPASRAENKADLQALNASRGVR